MQVVLSKPPKKDARMIEALKIVGAIIFLLGGLGGFILILCVVWSELTRDRRYDNW